MTSLLHPGAGVLNFHVKNPDATIYVGSLDSQADEHILWELFIRCGPIISINIPRDKVHRTHTGYAFIEFKLARDADYACKIMHNIRLYGRPIRVNKADKDQKQDNEEWLVKLFIGNLSPEIDESILVDIFGRFGPVLSCHVVSDPDTRESLGYAFLIYPTFESGDAAIQSLNGQYVNGQQIHVDYAFIKDGDGRRHGSKAERLLAAKAQENNLVPVDAVNLATVDYVGSTASTSTSTQQYSSTLSSSSSPSSALTSTPYHDQQSNQHGSIPTTTTTSTGGISTQTPSHSQTPQYPSDTSQQYHHLSLPVPPPPPPGVPPPPFTQQQLHTTPVPPPPLVPPPTAFAPPNPYMYPPPITPYAQYIYTPQQQQHHPQYPPLYQAAAPPPPPPPHPPQHIPPKYPK